MMDSGKLRNEISRSLEPANHAGLRLELEGALQITNQICASLAQAKFIVDETGIGWGQVCVIDDLNQRAWEYLYDEWLEVKFSRRHYNAWQKKQAKNRAAIADAKRHFPTDMG
jgi:hypothetical protein